MISMYTCVFFSAIVFLAQCEMMLSYEKRQPPEENPPKPDIKEKWEGFKKKYNKHYTNKYEELKREKVFEDNLKMIENHNDLYNKGLKTFAMGVNPFADLEHDEFLKLRTGLIPLNKTKASSRNYIDHQTRSILSKRDLNKDWRSEGYVTEVKDQGNCGSCWAFSATGTLEGQYFKKTGVLVPLSEQNLIDCSIYNYGCNGGIVQYAYDFIQINGGINSEQAYPYTAREGTCRNYSNGFIRTGIQEYIDIPEGNEEALRNAVEFIGPVSVAVDASHLSFQLYTSGVYYEINCSPQNLDHAVLVVGYGTKNGLDYWLIKNSWGKLWGEEGYMKLARNKGNHCGVATQSCFPVLTSN